MDYLQKISYKDTKNSWDFEGFSTLFSVENYLLWLLFGRSGKGKKIVGRIPILDREKRSISMSGRNDFFAISQMHKIFLTKNLGYNLFV